VIGRGAFYNGYFLSAYNVLICKQGESVLDIVAISPASARIALQREAVWWDAPSSVQFC